MDSSVGHKDSVSAWLQHPPWGADSSPIPSLHGAQHQEGQGGSLQPCSPAHFPEGRR